MGEGNGERRVAIFACYYKIARILVNRNKLISGIILTMVWSMVKRTIFSRNAFPAISGAHIILIGSMITWQVCLQTSLYDTDEYLQAF